MTQLLEQAITQIKVLSDTQQDSIALRLLEELEDAKWDALLARPEAQVKLNELADQALEEHLAGRTRALDDEC
jgi:O-methyltransferase involved in polyketide biosynthesis